MDIASDTSCTRNHDTAISDRDSDANTDTHAGNGRRDCRHASSACTGEVRPIDQSTLDTGFNRSQLDCDFRILVPQVPLTTGGNDEIRSTEDSVQVTRRSLGRPGRRRVVAHRRVQQPVYDEVRRRRWAHLRVPPVHRSLEDGSELAGSDFDALAGVALPADCPADHRGRGAGHLRRQPAAS